MSQEAQEKRSKLDEIRPVLTDIPAEKVREPNMPVDFYVGEVENTLAAARQHWARFQAIGFPERWLQQANDGVRVLTAAQAAWVAARDRGRPEAERTLVAGAYVMRDDLIDATSYVFRANPAAQGRLAVIREGEGVADLAQDLKDVAALIETGRAEFEAIQFDFELLERARAMSDEVLRIRATNTVQKILNEAKELRDRVYTWTNEAVDEIRAAGLYVMRKESRPEWLAMFRSRHAIAKKRRHRDRSPALGAAVANPPLATSPSAPAATSSTPPTR